MQTNAQENRINDRRTNQNGCNHDVEPARCVPPLVESVVESDIDDKAHPIEGINMYGVRQECMVPVIIADRETFILQHRETQRQAKGAK